MSCFCIAKKLFFSEYGSSRINFKYSIFNDKAIDENLTSKQKNYIEVKCMKFIKKHQKIFCFSRILTTLYL